MKPIDILIPVYNEGAYIKQTLINLLSIKEYKLNINIVYDNDNDTTIPIVLNNFKNLNIKLHKNNNIGMHSAIMTGFKKTTADAVIVYMADDEFNIEALKNMIFEYIHGSEIVVASRFRKNSKIKNINFLKRVITFYGSYFAEKVIGIKVSDSTFAFRLFSRKIIKNYKIESSKGFTYGIELLVKAMLDNNKITEVTANWIDHKYKKSRFKFVSWLPSYGYWLYYFLKSK